MTYTPEQTQQIVHLYTDNHTPEQIAALVDRTARSVIAKLTHLGVYDPPQQLPRALNKTELVAAIAMHLGLQAGDLESLAAATKPTLAQLHEAIVLQALGDVLDAELQACEAQQELI